MKKYQREIILFFPRGDATIPTAVFFIWNNSRKAYYYCCTCVGHTYKRVCVCYVRTASLRGRNLHIAAINNNNTRILKKTLSKTT